MASERTQRRIDSLLDEAEEAIAQLDSQVVQSRAQAARALDPTNSDAINYWRDVSRVVQITSRFPATHGALVHVGKPSAIGIKDILKPEYGDAVELREGEVPVFWGCGVTPQEAILRSSPSFAITHSAGRMFITDLRDQEISVL